MESGIFPFSDLALARRLERAEGATNVAFVEARARLQPEVGAEWIEVAGAYGMFDGVGSWLTQSFGLGVFDPVGDEELVALEAFFTERGAEVFHEVSPMADPGLLEVLGRRGYRPIELTSVLCRPIVVGDADAGGGTAGEREEPVPAEGRGAGGGSGRPRVRRTDPGEVDLWADVAAEGWSSESAEVGDFMRRLGRVTASSRGVYAFLAELEGRPIATGMLSLVDGVALLGGASTIPAGRRRGAQRALLEARLRFAAENGCDLAMMGAAPGGASQRNAQRQGFRIAYTRIKWQLHKEQPRRR